MKNQKSILFYFQTVNICHFAISMLSLTLIHLRVKWLRCNIIGREFWYDNFFPRMKMILALLRQQKRSIVLPCLCFATGTRKWPRFVRMFTVKCYLLVVLTTNCCQQLAAVHLFDLIATEIIFMAIYFSMMSQKEDAAQNKLSAQVNLLLWPMSWRVQF